jgi:5,10-methylene-tetrahydrofolate dehydrogenase/methenyl tetrahydrofolate cyclohydrolase
MSQFIKPTKTGVKKMAPPVPGGVGPMTRAMLMKNTLLAYKHTIYKD